MIMIINRNNFITSKNSCYTARERILNNLIIFKLISALSVNLLFSFFLTYYYYIVFNILYIRINFNKTEKKRYPQYGKLKTEM